LSGYKSAIHRLVLFRKVFPSDEVDPLMLSPKLFNYLSIADYFKKSKHYLP
jgi:hypothetical protein